MYAIRSYYDNIEFSAENESVTNQDVIKLRSGSYMYKLRIGNTIETKRMDLLG